MRLHRAGEHIVAELAVLFSVARSTIYRALERAGAAAHYAARKLRGPRAEVATACSRRERLADRASSSAGPRAAFRDHRTLLLGQSLVARSRRPPLRPHPAVHR